ncbi:MAG: AAA family ATPase, partial [Thiogranum sp.]
MFESFYRFDENPFRLNPDEKFRYIHPNYLKAWSYLKYGLDRAEGFVMITGEPGTGKTTLVRNMLSELDPAKYLQVTLVSNQLQAEELLRLLALEFGFKADSYNKATLLTRIQNYTSEQYAAGRRAILIVDEAQNLDSQALEELRLLSNLQAENQSLFQIFLIGQEELRNNVLGPGLEQLKQRLVATFRIEAMNAAQTEGYIEHRLGVVGWLDDPSFNPSIYPLIYRFTQGIPRKINHILSRLLLYGALEGKHRLDQDDLWVVLEELNDEVSLLPDSSMDFEALKQETRENALLAEIAQQKVAQSDIANRESLKTAPADAEKEPITNFNAPLNDGQQQQLSNESCYPIERGEDSTTFPEAPPLSPQGLTPTGQSETLSETSSLPESRDDRLSPETDEKAESEPLSITPAIEQAAIESVPETESETDRKDLFFGGLERFFHWAAYTVGVAALAFVILQPQTNELADLWHDLKLQGMQILGLSHQHQTDSQPPE